METQLSERRMSVCDCAEMRRIFDVVFHASEFRIGCPRLVTELPLRNEFGNMRTRLMINRQQDDVALSSLATTRDDTPEAFGLLPATEKVGGSPRLKERPRWNRPLGNLRNETFDFLTGCCAEWLLDVQQKIGSPRLLSLRHEGGGKHRFGYETIGPRSSLSHMNMTQPPLLCTQQRQQKLVGIQPNTRRARNSASCDGLGCSCKHLELFGLDARVLPQLQS